MALELLFLNVVAFKILTTKTKIATLQMISIAAEIATKKLIKIPIELNPLTFVRFMHIHDSEFWNFYRPFI